MNRAAVVLELDGFGEAAIGEPLPRHRTPPCVSIAQSRIAMASASLSSGGESAGPNGLDHRLLVGIALAGDEALDRPDGDALVWNLVLFAPGG